MLCSKNRLFLTDYFQIFNLIFTVIFHAIAAVFVFKEPYFVELNVYLVIIACAVGTGGYYYWKHFYHKYTLTFALIVLCGVVAKVAMLSLLAAPRPIQFLFFFTFNCISFCLYIPISNVKRTREMPYGKNKILVLTTSIFLLLLLVGSTIFLAILYPEHSTEILIFQTFYTLFIGSSIDLCVHCLYGISYSTWRDVESKVASPPAPPEEVEVLVKPSIEPRRCTEPLKRLTPTAPPVEASSSSSAPECQVCFEPYSEHKIPRMLTSCGHSMCQDCAKQILGSQDHVICPYCRKITVVNGTIESLPRNYALL